MKTKNRTILNVTLVILGIINSIIFVIYVHDDSIDEAHKRTKSITNSILELTEQAYFEGQKDAINGDIRIILVKDTLNDSVKWVWLKSPWKSGNKPIYNP